MIRDGESFIESLEQGDSAYRQANAERTFALILRLCQRIERLQRLRERAKEVMRNVSYVP